MLFVLVETFSRNPDGLFGFLLVQVSMVNFERNGLNTPGAIQPSVYHAGGICSSAFISDNHEFEKAN